MQQAGIRQGCPLSGLLFAICADVLMSKLEKMLCNGDEIVRAFADDTAAVVPNLAESADSLLAAFHEHAAKTVRQQCSGAIEDEEEEVENKA